MRRSSFLLYLAVFIFLLSAAAILASVERGSKVLAVGGACGNIVAGVLFLLSVWVPRRKVDWERIEAEQRLWESGPLGRRWLKTRRRIYRRWKM